MAITLKTIEGDNIEMCRELCNELMAFQKSKATFHPENFDMMNFETRLKRSYDGAKEKQLVVAYDGEKPIGYVFSTVETVGEEARSFVPAWAKNYDSIENMTGFYPDWLELPQKLGSVNNLYVKPEYQGQKLGSTLFQTAMDWLKGYEDVQYVFIDVSNGNTRAYDYYLRHGFQLSHQVFGGFIQALYYKQR